MLGRYGRVCGLLAGEGVLMIRFLAPYIIGAMAMACLAGGLFYAGVRHQSNETNAKNAREYIDGTEDARDATTDLPSDDVGNIEWLREWSTH